MIETGLDYTTSSFLERVSLHYTEVVGETSGVQSTEDVVKLLLAGADAVMPASALLRRGPELLGELTDGLSAWLTEREYSSVEQLKGSMSQESCGDSRAFERAQYVRAIVDYQLRGRTIG